MKELSSIIQQYQVYKNSNTPCALATLVHTEGSSYRRPGARMLVGNNGELTGAISGGCLEGDALRKAQYVMTKNESMLVTYDTMDDEDDTLGVGLGCNGIIQVLIEPLDPEAKTNPLRLLEQIENSREPAALVTLFSLENKNDKQPGTCLLIKNSVDWLGDAGPLTATLLADARNVLDNGNHLFRNYISPGLDIIAFIEYIQPTISLVIAGAGNDIVPVVEMANVLGWNVIVADGKSHTGKLTTFGQGCRVMTAQPAALVREIDIDDRTVFLLMSHNYNYDFAFLKALLPHPFVYIGILGPRKKWDRMRQELSSEGIMISETQLSNIYNPIGLDIGASHPEEIALSILAEINSVMNRKHGTSLRDKNDVIHDREQTIIEKIHLP